MPNRSDPSASFEDTLARTIRAAPRFAATTRQERAMLLAVMANELDDHRDELVTLGQAETHYSAEVLVAEVQRTTDQLRFFGEVILDGAYLERATHTDDPSVDVHRMLVPLGAVAVFGSSNFPFAYGVAGGDSASALAAGCAVVAKEHPSHPLTCRAVLALLRTALEKVGMDVDTVTLVSGLDAGIALVNAPGIRAVGFTGSTAGGRALYDLAANRPSPIPFYGELGSFNPVVVSAAAADERAEEIGALLADSLLRRAGQMCTKPGVILVPRGEAGDELVRTMATRIGDEPAVRLLNETVREQYAAGTQALSDIPGVTVSRGLPPRHRSGDSTAEDLVQPALFEASADAFSGVADLREIFGPTSIVLRTTDPAGASRVLGVLEPALVGGLHVSSSEDPDAGALLQALLPVVGRVVANGPTTGLSVGWATHHGGGYPAATSVHSSVGASAIRRWLRPVSYQGVPESLLPEDLRDAHHKGVEYQRDEVGTSEGAGR
jgi:NADP-dependent aldehyde dehydrogenase